MHARTFVVFLRRNGETACVICLWVSAFGNKGEAEAETHADTITAPEERSYRGQKRAEKQKSRQANVLRDAGEMKKCISATTVRIEIFCHFGALHAVFFKCNLSL